MSRGIFITGTDTDVGKTVITGLLARYLLEKGYKVITQKWIETGSRGYPDDIRMHLKLMHRSPKEIEDYLELVSPYRFKLASSPHLASRIEGKEINPVKIISSFRKLSSKFDFVLVEGTGGALVPLNKKYLVMDIVKKLNLPVLIVAQNKLGAINHTLLTIDALKQRKIKILGLIFNNLKREDKRIIDDNPKIIREITKERLFGVLPWDKRHNALYKKFIKTARNIDRILR